MLRQSYDRDQLERLLATVQQFITILVYETTINDKFEAGVQILDFLYRVNEKSQVLNHMSFYNDAVNSEDFNIVAEFKFWMERSSFSFCDYPFVYDTSSKSN
ncbi:hypothetical protein SUGI_0146420 [Cryptomeria japonica]|nr:hypothetical protein SUGI_0146420 [Cryptomeria japonica]